MQNRITNVLLAVIAVCLILLTIDAYTVRPAEAQGVQRVRIEGGILDDIKEPVKVTNERSRAIKELNYQTTAYPLEVKIESN